MSTGYIPLVIITGLAVQFFPKNRTFQLLGMIAATAVLYTDKEIGPMGMAKGLTAEITAAITAVIASG